MYAGKIDLWGIFAFWQINILRDNIIKPSFWFVNLYFIRSKKSSVSEKNNVLVRLIRRNNGV